MVTSKRMYVAIALTAVLAIAGCGSSKKAGAGSSNTSGSSEPTYTVGVLTDLTGLGATNNHTFPQGVAAGVGIAAGEGYKIKYIVVDTQTSPVQALQAAHQLVDQDHVFAVLTLSSLTFAAAPYLTSKGIPVIGAAQDASEWVTSRNMFSVFGTADYTKVFSQAGLIYKKLGGTNLASIGYSISPSSADSAKATAVAAHLQGLKVGYLNANFPFGSTNVGPAALAIKAAGSDSLSASIETNTEWALIDTLRTLGITLKVAVAATGYGGDLAFGGPGGERSAQGVYFPLSWEPVELHTAATEKLVSALKTYAGLTTAPGYGQYLGYMSVDAFVQGLKLAGPHPTQAGLINAMLGITNYNGDGLYGSHSVNFTMASRGLTSGADNCDWVVRYTGSSFHLISGMEPLCGETVAGVTINTPTS